jgi:hypothetical protein
VADLVKAVAEAVVVDAPIHVSLLLGRNCADVPLACPVELAQGREAVADLVEAGADIGVVDTRLHVLSIAIIRPAEDR